VSLFYFLYSPELLYHFNYYLYLFIKPMQKMTADNKPVRGNLATRAGPAFAHDKWLPRNALLIRPSLTYHSPVNYYQDNEFSENIAVLNPLKNAEKSLLSALRIFISRQ